MRQGEPDFSQLEDIYRELQDGAMPPCLGAQCPASCCTQHLAIRGQTFVQYQTLLWGKSEADFQLAHGINDRGATIHKVPAAGYRVPGKKIPDQDLYFVANCQNKDGSCRLVGQKPIACNTYPFSMDSEHPLAVTCPRAVEITKDNAVVDRIMTTRRILGFQDNPLWIFNMRELSSGLEEVRGLPIQFGSRDYR